MLAKMTAKNQLTLPKSVTAAVGPAEYFDVADVLRETLTPLQNSIRAAFIYGSVAKGNDTARSDILVRMTTSPNLAILAKTGQLKTELPRHSPISIQHPIH
jgi:predicted nucleotidyltransferase